MDAYNAEKSFDEKRSLKYYSVRGTMPSVKEDPNMHVCAHLYASDRNSLFVMCVVRPRNINRNVLADWCSVQITSTSATTTRRLLASRTPWCSMVTLQNST